MSPWVFKVTGAGEKNGLRRQVSHCVAECVDNVQCMMGSGVVEFYVDGILFLCVVLYDDSYRVPDLRERESGCHMIKGWGQSLWYIAFDEICFVFKK